MDAQGWELARKVDQIEHENRELKKRVEALEKTVKDIQATLSRVDQRTHQFQKIGGAFHGPKC